MNPSSKTIFLKISLLSILIFAALLGQTPPLEWGEIPRADLEMKSYPADTNASALILSDFGETKFDNELHLVFTKHCRVKILTTKGYAWGTHIVDIYSFDHTETISGIEGVTYTLDATGQIVKHPLERKDIYEEELDRKNTRYRFTLPSLTPGCILEYRYTINSENIWYIRDWVFQHDEPVLWSEYRVTSPKSIAYAAVTNGYERFVVNEVNDATQVFAGLALSYLGNPIAPCNSMRWVVKNVPAIRIEPFTTTSLDYRNKVNLQLAGYAFVGGGVKHVLNTWDNLAKELMDESNFGGAIDDTRRVTKLTEGITSSLKTPEEKLCAIYQWITSSIVWTGESRIFAKQEVNDILETKKGNSAEVTFLLLSMLKSVGIAGDPVILSTRSNGKIQELYPIFTQFNYTIAKVNIDSTTYLVDATDRLRPIELLPTKILNVRGLIVTKEGGTWLTLNSAKRDINVSSAEVRIRPDGSLTGSVEDCYRDYGNLHLRHRWEERKDIDVAKAAFDLDPTGVSIDSLEVEGKDSVHENIRFKAQISADSYAQRNGDLIYINPQIMHRLSENPLKSRDRKFPVDYGCGQEQTTVITITVPDSFEIKDKPLDRAFYVNSTDASYQRQVLVQGHTVQVTSKFLIQRTEVPAASYQQLRNFYARIVAAESEQLVLFRTVQALKPTEPLPQGQKTEGKKVKK